LSRQYASQLQFEVYPSRQYQLIVLLIAAVSCVALLLIDFRYSVINILLFFLLMTILVISLKNNCHRSFHWKADQTWTIVQMHDQFQINAQLLPGSVVTSFAAVLNFKLENNKRLNVLLFKDNIDAEAFRKLRVRLKVEGI